MQENLKKIKKTTVIKLRYESCRSLVPDLYVYDSPKYAQTAGVKMRNNQPVINARLTQFFSKQNSFVSNSISKSILKS